LPQQRLSELKLPLIFNPSNVIFWLGYM